MRLIRKDNKQVTPKKGKKVFQRRNSKGKCFSIDWRTASANLQLPVTASKGIHLGSSLRSLMGVRTPSKLPNMEERPKLKSMTKKRMAHTCEPGISSTASVNTIKARPVPDALWGRMELTRMHELTAHVEQQHDTRAEDRLVQQRREIWKMFSKLQHLVKESLQFTDPQLQTGHLIWICCIEIFNPLVIVYKSYILVWNVKMVGQSQDVPADGIKISLIGISKRGRSFRPGLIIYLCKRTLFDSCWRRW